MTGRAKIVLVALDAADMGILQRCVDQGQAPVIGRLLAEGALGNLDSLGRWLPGSVWPSFFTSSPPSDTGFHHYLQWSPQTMTMRRPDPRQPGEPFWRRIADEGGRVIAIDMPFASAPSTGIELTGWATLDSLEPPRSHPSSLLTDITARHGGSPRVAEMHALQSMDALRKLRDEQVEIAGMLAEISEHLLQRETVDLFAITFPGLHRGGHWLWDETGLLTPPTAAEQRELEAALPAVYAATDQALGRVLDAAQPDEVILFSLHGMGPNTSRVEVLDAMLDRVLGEESQNVSPLSTMQRIRHALPPRLRHRVKDSLPTSLQDRLTGFWRTGGRDWQKTPALTQVADLTGYIRLNRKGRENQGMLTAAQADEITQRIVEGLASFADADTGEPVVRQTARVEDVVPPGPNRDRLPDLMVDWNDTPAARHRAIVSPRFGTIDWPTPGCHPSGRSGNHRAGGFYLVSGSGTTPGSAPSGNIVDLAPTILARLGAAVPDEMRGRALLGGGIR
ncbi:alkaline phosphatase family protein [Tropicimonas marinistellae]|uniref:alkaline phosphatase family protein n=1 Tax=Tropicimonas marinistellae TaxID=1739787 RepID=UPI00083221F0|nr:alkaline phosphatase family protein [Tropicimonas marinistellae]